MIGNLNDETNFPHKLLLTNRQIANLCKAFANYLSANIQDSGLLLGFSETIKQLKTKQKNKKEDFLVCY